MHDLIERQAAIEAVENIDCSDGVGISALKCEAVDDGVTAIKALPSAQPEKVDTPTVDTPNCDDTISRKAAIEFIHELQDSQSFDKTADMAYDLVDWAISEIPSAQPEPLSEAYAKAVHAWLLDYQIKSAELKGRYAPYEVLSWVANDWRREHERSDRKTCGD